MRYFVACLLAIACASRANAGIVNGGFENGFNGWSTLGFTSIQTSAFGSGPTEGTQQALMESGDGTTSATLADLDTFFGFAAGQLNSISTGSVAGRVGHQADVHGECRGRAVLPLELPHQRGHHGPR